MSYAQVICAILVFALCGDTLGKAIDHVRIHGESRQRERSRRQIPILVSPYHYVNVEDSFREDVPVMGTFGKTIVNSEKRFMADNRGHAPMDVMHSPVSMMDEFPNRFFSKGLQVPVTSSGYQRNVRPVKSPQTPRPYVYQSTPWSSGVKRIPQNVKTHRYGTSTVKTPSTTEETFPTTELDDEPKCNIQPGRGRAKREGCEDVYPVYPGNPPVTEEPTTTEVSEITGPSAVAPMEVGINVIPKKKPEEEVPDFEEDERIEVPCFCAVGGPKVKEALDKGMHLREIKTVKTERGINIVAVDKNRPPPKEDPSTELHLEGDCNCEFVFKDSHDEHASKSASDFDKNGRKRK